MASRDVYERGFDESTGQTTETNDCPDCGGTVRTDGGEQRCVDCGLVVEACRLDRSGPRTFPDDDGSKQRTGAPLTAARHDRGLSTRIGHQQDARGNTLSNAKRRRLARMRREHSRARFRSKRERNLAHGMGTIARLTATLDLPRSVREQASSLFRTAQQEDLLVGRSIEAIAAGSVYAVCRLNDAIRTVDDVTDASRLDRDQVRQGYTALNRELALPTPPQQPQEFVPGHASALDLPSTVERRARVVATEAVDAGLATGVNPSGFAAACLAVVARDRGVDVTQQALASVADVSPATVRKHRDRVHAFLG